MNNPSANARGKESDPSKPVVRFEGETTIRWECQPGDLVAWIPCPALLGGGDGFKVTDIWETRAGDRITISNRPEDFPPWFHLAPTEITGALVYAMMAKLNSREIPDSEPVQAANVWRLPAGSRLAWMGVRRRAYPTFEGEQGLLQIVDFWESALVVGESPSMGAEAFLKFGALATRSPSPEVGEMLGAARKWVRQLGMPRVMATDWAIG